MGAREQQFLDAVEERRRALDAAGLPECDWMIAREAEPPPQDIAGAKAFSRRIEEHVATCPTCIARVEYADEHVGPLPEMPVPVWVRAILTVPPRLLPAAAGAIAIGSIVIARAAFQPRVVMELGILRFIIVLLAAMAAGASGGLVYALVRPTLRRLGVAGDYLTGIATILAYMFTLAALAPVIMDEPIMSSDDVLSFVVISVFFGLVLGWSMSRRRT